MATNVPLEQSGAADYIWQDLECILPENIARELLHNNPPTHGALQYVNAARANPTELLQAARQRACRLDEQIKTLQAEKAILADESRVRGTLTKVFNTISSPIRRLPEDIIREIAHHATEDTYPSPERTSTAIALARVCSTWRSVILSSPRLWSTLYLRVQNISHHGIMQYHQAVQIWFCRAGCLPLQLFLYFDFHNIPPPTEPSAHTIKLFLRSLAPWTSRICRLGVGSHDWMRIMANFAEVEWALPNLRRLDILGQKSNEDLREEEMSSLEPVMDRITLFRSSTLLTTLSASQEISSFLRRLPLFPWQQFTDISLDEELCLEVDFFNLLRHCPHLRHAQLEVDTDSDSTIPTFTHANLEVLQLHLIIRGYNKVVDFFTPYCFPNLTSLWVEIITDKFYHTPPDPTGDFGNFVPFPSLRTLVTNGQPLPTPLVVNMLRNSPLLRNLNMDIYGGLKDEPLCDVSELCRAMTLQQGQHNLVPLLEECSFHYTSYLLHRPLSIFTLDAAVISSFVQSRMRAIPSTSSSLKKAVFSGGFRSLSDIDEDVLQMNVLQISSCRGFSVEEQVQLAIIPVDLQIPAFAQDPDMDSYRFLVRHTQ